MNLTELEAAMTARNLQAVTIAYVTTRGEWQASLRPRGGDGWRIDMGATVEEAVAGALAQFRAPVVSDSSADEVDLFG
jgi:predicted TIM-barrel enzyme